jgi:NifB/MoaA-like Fe-S oxidoreductase
VYPSDEFFLLADQPVPSVRSYDDFPQLANGIGLTRLLLDDWKRVRRRVEGVRWSHHKVTLVCGTLIAPTMQALAAELAALLKTGPAENTGWSTDIEVVAVPNLFFGQTVTVSGLLLAEDVVNTLRTKNPGDLVVLPRAMFDAVGERTLDNQTQVDIERQIGSRVAAADGLSEVLDL